MPTLRLIVLAACLVLPACYSDRPAEVDEAAAQQAIPIGKPNLDLGAELFRLHCQSCHGETGRGDGPWVQRLEGPRPRDFLDTRMMVQMSPRRAYEAITHGVPKTSMGSFDRLLESERWHLAFFVLALGATPEDSERGRQEVEPLHMQSPSLRALASLSNLEILDDLRSRNLQEVSARNGLAYFRREVPYTAITNLPEFRQSLSLALAHYRRDSHARAIELMRAAYLNQLRPALTVLRLRHAGLALTTTRQLNQLIEEMQQNASSDAVAKSARELVWLLDVASPLANRKEGASIGAAESASLVHSFALDGALLTFLLLVIAGRYSASSREKWAVHSGIIVGCVLAILLWLLRDPLAGIASGPHRAIAILFVSAFLALVTIPFLGTLVRHYRWPQQQIEFASGPRLLLEFLLPVLVISRDAMEIVPAMTSISQSSPNALYGCAGAAAALVALVALLVILFHNLRANAQIVLLATLALLVVLSAAGSFGDSAHALGWLESTPKGYLQSPWLSFWPTRQNVLLQLIACTAGTLVLLGTTLLRVETDR